MKTFDFVKMAGFTLIELIMVIVMLGVLAIVAVPRLNTSGFDARGFHDQTLAALRYAHKSAIAQRRTVCAAFSSNSVTLTMASAAGSSTCDTNLAGPTGDSPYNITAPTGVTFVATPSDFNFNALGQASTGQALQVNDVPFTITVVQETGHVY